MRLLCKIVGLTWMDKVCRFRRLRPHTRDQGQPGEFDELNLDLRVAKRDPCLHRMADLLRCDM